jgi:hypothetical protein
LNNRVTTQNKWKGAEVNLALILIPLCGKKKRPAFKLRNFQKCPIRRPTDESPPSPVPRPSDGRGCRRRVRE